MATCIENLEARRDAICEELAALGTDKAGGLPNSTSQGIDIDHQGYKQGLYDELDAIDEQIRKLRKTNDEPYVDVTYGVL